MKMVMANHPDLLKYVYNEVISDSKLIDIEAVRSLVSSPRLMDFNVRKFLIKNLSFVGDSFLDQRTMLADSPQKTFGISLLHWSALDLTNEIIDDYCYSDTNVVNIQVWPFDPSTLTEHQARVAVALSYTRSELYGEPRIIGSLNEILEEIGFFIDPERY